MGTVGAVPGQADPGQAPGRTVPAAGWVPQGLSQHVAEPGTGSAPTLQGRKRVPTRAVPGLGHRAGAGSGQGHAAALKKPPLGGSGRFKKQRCSLVPSDACPCTEDSGAHETNTGIPDSGEKALLRLSMKIFPRPSGRTKPKQARPYLGQAEGSARTSARICLKCVVESRRRRHHNRL